MRDPITRLAVIEPESVDKDLLPMFPSYFSGAKVPLLHYVGRIERKTKYGTEKSIMLVSNECVYICRDVGPRPPTKRRCIRVADISEAVILQDASLVLLRVPSEYDVLFKLVDTETHYLLNVLRVIRSFRAEDHKPLKVSPAQGSLKDLRPNLTKPNNYVNQMHEIPLFSDKESRALTLDSFLAPPPPPTNKAARPAVDQPSTSALSILKHPLFDGEQSDRPSGTPEKFDVAPVPSTTKESPDFQSRLAVLHNVQADLAARQKGQLEDLRSASAHEDPQNTPPREHSVISAPPPAADNNELTSVSRAWLSPSDIRRPKVQSAGNASNSPSANEIALQSRVNALEEQLACLREELQLSHARVSAPAPAAPQRNFSPQFESVSPPRYAPMQTSSLSPKEDGLSTFEQGIATHPLSDRVVLRKYRIDDLRAQISTTMQREDYDAVQIFNRQEELMELLRIQEADMSTLASEDPRSPALRPASPAQSPLRSQPHALPGHSQETFMQWMAAVTHALAEQQGKSGQERPTRHRKPSSGRSARRTADWKI